MADRIHEQGMLATSVDPANATGWLYTMEAMAVVAGQDGQRLSVQIPVAATDNIATWEAKRRDAYRAAFAMPTAPVILLPYKVAT